MDLDLQQDSAEIYAHVLSRVARYSPTEDHGPGGVAPVKMIYAGYEFDQAGWFALILDRRPDAANDGTWTLYLEGNLLARPAWLAARARNATKPLRVRMADGQVQTLPPRSAFGPLLGEMIVAVLLRAEREGVYSALPLADDPELGLEEFNGSFGWSSLDGPGGEPGSNPAGTVAKPQPKPGSPIDLSWKTRWPRNGDLKAWIRAMLRKCDAIPDDDAAATRAHSPIGELARIGRVAEALRHVDRFLRRLPRQVVLATVRMALLGAKISLKAGELPRMEDYLAIAEATEPFNTRKRDKGFSINAVREFRAENGLLDPADAIDDKQRITARFERAHRQFRQAVAAGERKAAQVAVAEMEGAAREAEDKWWRRSYLGRVLGSYAELKDADALARCIQTLDEGDRHEILDTATLMRLGMRSQAIERARQDVAGELEVLGRTTNPNIHGPTHSICRSLKFLVEQGEKEEATRSLRRALTEMPTWRVIEQGWTTSAVYHSLAQVMALIEGPAAAEELLRSAAADARAEKRGDFRQGAVEAALQLKADLGGLGEAIEDARKIRSPTERRKALTPLLAKARRWKELREVLSQVDSPEEAADLAWWIKFELPGGEVR